MSFFRYLRDHARLMILMAALVAFPVAVIGLNGANAQAAADALYVAAVCLTVCAVALLIDYSLRRRQILRIRELSAGDDYAPQLPEPADLKDILYGRWMGSLYDRYSADRRQSGERDRESREFMIAWAHEIKTPLTAARLLLDSAPDTDETRSLREELDRMGEAVERVLYHARSDSFSRDYILAEEALLPLVRENVRKHSALFIRKHIGVSLDVPEGLTVDTDRKWLLFIMDQLLSNALKYTDDGGHIAITVRREGDETVLAYRDNGCGIRPEDLRRVFEPAFTGEKGREPGSAATGLGLYLARKLAGKLSHRVTLSSRYGYGTEACIHFSGTDEFLNVAKM